MPETRTALASGPGRPGRWGFFAFPGDLKIAMSVMVVFVLLLPHHSNGPGPGGYTGLAEAKQYSQQLCSKFPDFCKPDPEEAEGKDKFKNQRFTETKWRKPKTGNEIGGHLAPKRPPKNEEKEIDEAERLRAATIREAEEKLRLAQQGKGKPQPQVSSFEQRKTEDDARRKLQLIQEVRRRRRQKREEEDKEEDDEDEMVVEVEEEESEEPEDDDDDAVVEDDDSEEDESEELLDSEEKDDKGTEESSEEEYEEDAKEEEEEEEEESEEEHQPEISEEYDEPEDEDEWHARKKLKELVSRKKKWKEEEARIKKREEERKKAEEERKKREDEIRRKRIEEIRKKKRQAEEEKRRKEEEEEEQRRLKLEEAQRKESEERERDLQRLREEVERLKREREEKERQERELERKRRLEEEIRKRKEFEERQKQIMEEEERKRRVEEEEERRREEERQELERQKREQAEEEERQRKKAEDEERQRKKTAEEERQRKIAEEQEKQRKKAADEERQRKIAAEKERQRKIAEEEERQRKQEEEEAKQQKIVEEEERQRKKASEEERQKKQAVEEEKQRQAAEDDTAKLKKKVEEERSKKIAEEEKKRKQAQEEKRKQNAMVAKARHKGEQDDDDDEDEEDHDAGIRIAKMIIHDDDDDAEEAEEKKDTKVPVHKKVKADLADMDVSPEVPWMSGFPEFFAPTADDDVRNEECKKQSRIFVQHLAKYRTWALNMYDATAKLPAGIFSGNAIQLGDYDECLGVDVRLRQRSAASSRGGRSGEEEDEGPGTLTRAVSWLTDLMRPVLEPVLGLGPLDDPGLVHIRGRYCLASIDLDLHRSKSRPRDQETSLRLALDRALSHSFLKGSINDTTHFVPRFRTLGWGLCVPSACGARDVEGALRGAIARFQRSGAWGSGLLRTRVSVPAAACRDAAQGPALQRLPPTFFFAVGGVLALLLMTVIGTLNDTGEEPDELGGLRALMASFSLKRSWSALTTPEDPGADDIRCIHGVRALCSILLYVAHKVIPLSAQPFSNRAYFAEVASSPASMVLRASLVYTDTFLMLSGVLASFHLSRHLSRAGSLDWFSRLLTRVVRLTPTLGMVTALYAYVLEHLGSGPLWGQIVEENAKLCRANMWRNLLYIQNFWPFEHMCAPHTHQLALDMQLFLLVPPVVWLLVRAWPLASPIILVLLGGSTWLRQRAVMQHGISLLIYHGMKPSELYRAANHSYAQAPHRASAYLVGVVLGYVLHRMPRKLNVPKMLVLVGWVSCIALGGWALFGHRQVARFDYKYDVVEAARFSALAPLAWAVALAWLIFACFTGNGVQLESALCARPLVLLGRISYAFYLTQFIVFFYNAGSVRSQREFGVLSALDLWELLTVIAISVLVTLLVDLPMQSVRSAFAHSKRRQSLKWDPPPPSPSIPHELAAVYYYDNDGTDAYTYTSHSKIE